MGPGELTPTGADGVGCGGVVVVGPGGPEGDVGVGPEGVVAVGAPGFCTARSVWQQSELRNVACADVGVVPGFEPVTSI